MKWIHSSAGRCASLLLVVAGLGPVLTACAPLVIGAAMGGSVLVATDRRTSGIQLEDQSIEMKAASRLSEQFGSRARFNVISFNRRVLLLGEVPSEADRALAVKTVGTVENAKEIVDELAVQTSPSLAARSADSLVTARVKAAMVDAKDIYANAFKVVTERGTTYLMGRVTQREASRATEITRSISGVQRVVRVFEIISEAELQEMLPTPPDSNATGRR